MIDTETAAYLIGVVVPIAIAFLVGRKFVTKAQLQEVAQYASVAVTAAEEFYSEMPKSGQDKLRMAVDAVADKYGVDEKQATVLVLATVKTLRDEGILGAP